MEASLRIMQRLWRSEKFMVWLWVNSTNDPKNPSPTAPVDLVKTSKVYLETLGVTFRVE
jgi:hypothetical protein